MILAFAFLLLIGAASGISAAVYRFVLNQEPVLNWWFRFGDKYNGRWFYPPIWGCHKCISGQLTLWSCVIICIISGWPLQWLPIMILGTISAICIAIYVAIRLKKIIESTDY